MKCRCHFLYTTKRTVEYFGCDVLNEDPKEYECVSKKHKCICHLNPHGCLATTHEWNCQTSINPWLCRYDDNHTNCLCDEPGDLVPRLYCANLCWFFFRSSMIRRPHRYYNDEDNHMFCLHRKLNWGPEKLMIRLMPRCAGTSVSERLKGFRL